jgi:hypothetical protein
MAVICHEHSEVKFSVETSQTDDSVIDVSFSNVNALFWDRDHETSMECEKDDGESSMDPDMVSIDKTSFKVLPPVAGYCPICLRISVFSGSLLLWIWGEAQVCDAARRSSWETLIVDLENVAYHQLWLVCSEDETEMWKFGNKKLGPGKPDFDLTSVFECADEDDSDVVLE